MNRLDRVLDPLLDFHLDAMAYAESFASGASFKKVDPGAWLRTKGTLQVNPGRQTGKSCYIARAAGFKDIIICRDRPAFDHMVVRRQGFFMPDPGNMNVFMISSGNVYPDDIQDVWLDECSGASTSDLDLIYNKLAGKCRRIIMVG